MGSLIQRNSGPFELKPSAAGQAGGSEREETTTTRRNELSSGDAGFSAARNRLSKTERFLPQSFVRRNRISDRSQTDYGLSPSLVNVFIRSLSGETGVDHSRVERRSRRLNGVARRRGEKNVFADGNTALSAVCIGDAPNGHVADENSSTPERRFDCANYETCLGMAAALDWESFTCKGCCGDIDERLLWRAHHRLRNDSGLASVCKLPIIAIEHGLGVARLTESTEDPERTGLKPESAAFTDIATGFSLLIPNKIKSERGSE